LGAYEYTTTKVQRITFNPLPNKLPSDGDFALTASTSSGLGVTYTSSNSSVATVTNGQVHIVGEGITIITASQAGDGTFDAAPPVSQSLVVTTKSGSGDPNPTGDSNLIKNSTFDVNLAGWGGYREPSTSTTNELVSKSGYSGNVCKVNMANGGSVNWYVQLAYNFPIVEGKTYTISFKASADANRSIVYSFQQNVAPKKVYTTSPEINLTTTPTTYGPYTFNSTFTDNDQSFRFLLGASNISVYIDDVVITESSTITAIKPILNENSGLKVYPNPVSDFLNIDLAGVKPGKIGINLFDLNGRLILEKMFQSPNIEGLTCELNVGHVKEGVYLLKVRTNESLVSGLVMIQR
jgi:Secretion system C-terminal sorting domain/Carbohydrate binding domain